MKQNYYLSNILIKDYLITSRCFHRLWFISFFVQFVLQQLNLNSKINTAMNKFSSLNVTAGMLSKSFKKTVETLLTSNKGLLFINTIKGTPGLWKRFQAKVIAVIRQLGYPTFFMKLPCSIYNGMIL